MEIANAPARFLVVEHQSAFFGCSRFEEISASQM